MKHTSNGKDYTKKSKNLIGKGIPISQSNSYVNRQKSDKEIFDEERKEIINLLEQLFIKNSINYSWSQNNRFGDMYYNVLTLSSNYRLNDNSIATRNGIIKNKLQYKNPKSIYNFHVLVDTLKSTAMFSLKNNDESERSFKNWRFQVLKSDQ